MAYRCLSANCSRANFLLASNSLSAGVPRRPASPDHGCAPLTAYDRVDVRYGTSPHDAQPQLPVAGNVPGPGLQAGAGGRKKLAPDPALQRIGELINGTVFKDGIPAPGQSAGTTEDRR